MLRPLASPFRGVALSAVLCLPLYGTAFANQPPEPPTWIEPSQGATLSPYDPHFNVHGFVDPDSGDRHLSTDFEVWDDSLNVRVWSDIGETQLLYHVHFGDGVTEGPLEGETHLDFD